jgi:hypothetical protein
MLALSLLVFVPACCKMMLVDDLCCFSPTPVVYVHLQRLLVPRSTAIYTSDIHIIAKKPKRQVGQLIREKMDLIIMRRHCAFRPAESPIPAMPVHPIFYAYIPNKRNVNDSTSKRCPTSRIEERDGGKQPPDARAPSAQPCSESQSSVKEEQPVTCTRHGAEHPHLLSSPRNKKPSHLSRSQRMQLTKPPIQHSEPNPPISLLPSYIISHAAKPPRKCKPPRHTYIHVCTRGGAARHVAFDFSCQAPSARGRKRRSVRNKDRQTDRMG